MRAIITGQVGMDKKAYSRSLCDLARQLGENIKLYNVGDMMYAEAPDVAAGHILDLPLSRLNGLRRTVFKDILVGSDSEPHVIVNTHATFRWRHGLFPAFDFDQVKKFSPDTLICLVDNIEVVHRRLTQEHTVDATLKDLMVWREEEIMATELLAQALGGVQHFYILARGRHQATVETSFRLICRPQMPRVYLSFPMSHVVGMPKIQSEIDAFRTKLSRHVIAFDPGDVDEKLLLDAAIDAAKQGYDFVDAQMTHADHFQESFRVSVKQILDIAGDIDGQIYTRDFKLIDQANMIVSYIPELEGGIPGLSSGVERELQHAFEHGKEVYVIWTPRKNPSPFVTETATKVFRSVPEAMTYFQSKGMIRNPS
jgi:adenylate kinase